MIEQNQLWRSFTLIQISRPGARTLITVIAMLLLMIGGCSGDDGLTRFDEEIDKAISPAWLDMPLTDITSGESFKLSDFRGKYVLLEIADLNCDNCYLQERAIKKVEQKIGDKAEVVTMIVNSRASVDAVREYMASEDQQWLHSIDQEGKIKDALIGIYGVHVADPMKSPILIINPQGVVTLTAYGLKSSSKLLELLSIL